MERIDRNPVSSHTENRLSVYDKSEFAVSLRICGRGAIKLHRSDAHTLGVNVGDLAVFIKCEGDIVQILFSRVSRPPELRLFYCKREPAAGVVELGCLDKTALSARALQLYGVAGYIVAAYFGVVRKIKPCAALVQF